jgi:hypothetical protein
MVRGLRGDLPPSIGGAGPRTRLTSLREEGSTDSQLCSSWRPLGPSIWCWKTFPAMTRTVLKSLSPEGGAPVPPPGSGSVDPDMGRRWAVMA